MNLRHFHPILYTKKENKNKRKGEFYINLDLLKYNNNLNNSSVPAKQGIFHGLKVFKNTCETFHFLFHDSLVSFCFLQELTHLLLHFKYLRKTYEQTTSASLKFIHFQNAFL